MLAVLPFLAAPYPPIDPAPAPATSRDLKGLAFETGAGWLGTPRAVTEGDDLSGAGAADINVRMEVCCPRGPTENPDPEPDNYFPPVSALHCTLASTTPPYCDPDETLHTITAWEDGPSISVDGATLHYNYNISDFTQVVTCAQPCNNGCFANLCPGPGACDPTQEQAAREQCADQCAIHCGPPIYGPVRDMGTGDNRIFEAALAAVWSNSAAAKVAALDAAGVSDRAPSVAGNELALSRSGGTLASPDLYLSTLTGGNWGTPVDIDPTQATAPWINTACQEENPHIVEDADGLRLYFESDRIWDKNYLPGAQPLQPWDNAATDCIEAMRNLFVTRRDNMGVWSEPQRVNLPDADIAGAPWADIRKAAPFVTPGNPTDTLGDPPVALGRQIYWVGRANDCYPNSATDPIPQNANDASQGCIYRAEQSGDLAIDAPWTNVVKIATPLPILDGEIGDGGAVGNVVIVTNPSLSGDRTQLYFTFIEREALPDDVEPPVDVAESLDDSDPHYPPAKGQGIFLGDAPYQWQNWRFGKGLAHPANYDDPTLGTIGWEDSINISDDGRRLFFAYSAWTFGQGLFAQPNFCRNYADEQTCRIGRRAVPSILAGGPPRSVAAGGDPAASVGLNIHEATINPTTRAWEVAFSDVNWESYCTPDAQCGGTCQYPCLDRPGIDDDFCLNDPFGEVLSTSDPACFTPAEQGMNEGAVTVSTADDGVEHMLFVRYGDLSKLIADHLNSPKEVLGFRIHRTTKNCDGTGQNPGTGANWCRPAPAPFTIDDAGATDDEKQCIDNDPHLTAGGTSVYFDSNRHLIGQTPDVSDQCPLRDSDQVRVFHSRETAGVWSEPLEILGGPNLRWLPWTDPNCTACSTGGNCPFPCAPQAFQQGRKIYKGAQAFVTEDETLLYFTGDGPECAPDPGDPGAETAINTVGSCLYVAARADPPDQGTPPRPAFDYPFMVVRAQAHNALPCRYGPLGTDPDIGKITGLGEPSMTKDRHLLYFAYIRKLASGQPLDRDNIPPCDPGDPGDPEADPPIPPTPADDPSNPAEPLCKCTATFRPRGCWLPPCSEGGISNDTCKEVCTQEHVNGTDFDNNPADDPITDECLPPSVMYCQNPQASQSLTDTTVTGYGVDVLEFGIGAARRDDWNPSIGVVGAAQ